MMHWPVKRVGDFARTATGGTPSRANASFYGGSIPWVKSGELNDHYIFETEEALTDEGLARSNAKVFPKGTLCIALYGATVGKLGILGIDAATNQAVCGIFPPPDVDTKYLFHYLTLKKSDLIRKRMGGAQPNISQGIVRDIEVPLPPLNNQHRIVAEIEEQLTRLEAGVAALKRVQANLKRYHEAVLSAAIYGDLVGRASEGQWPSRKIRELAAEEANSIADGPFGSKLKTEHYTDSGPRVIRLQNIGDGRFVDEKAHISNSHFATLLKHRVFPGDLVIAGLGETLPRACMIPDDIGPAIVKADCIRFKAGSSVLPKYLLYALNAHPTRQATKARMHGIGRPRLNLSEIKSIMVPVPPITEQHRIVDEVERRLSVVEELEAQVQADLARADRLRQAVLLVAFQPQ